MNSYRPGWILDVHLGTRGSQAIFIGASEKRRGRGARSGRGRRDLRPYSHAGDSHLQVVSYFTWGDWVESNPPCLTTPMSASS